MAKHVSRLELTSEQEAEAQALLAKLRPALEQDALELCRLMASKQDHEIFGQTEYEVRDRVHRIGAKALEITANERAKKGVPR